ncbi:4-(cytidine 5'-diphospho)-2-C-methyl-D-erythritol kinase [Polynucleobacter wuianus]|uniref:4-diphosphocytidyl-2-C-methyl-D-erythritol kinase n=1 Tax=Polynucleobacter wuianus TaxID=1743168 RepID=A0A191UHM1_9BURK|nr:MULTISPECIES: 4-(cytidine 5'-diphospho)-2-C-methyl-D-erythritol kinase [Polynucleobacter]ANJ00505.1 4-(cytidine 5'-diphospho)-2-C-methyl-D-erythritol kinase [Polynucleobacter wuianus]MBU3553092.1 4-(cytidine 5'-diphospho)-2-C-methyl-D-erythritol kinase [Polynucleobacter sp. MWH-Post4-6-1]
MSDAFKDSLTLRSPAKLNLFLHIVGRRADGYHLLQSVFQLIDWCDTVSLKRIPENEIRHINPIPGVKPEDDLVVKAANLLKDFCKIKIGAEIILKKDIPMGAGLGGGSSDAATTLIGLNHLWNLHLDQKTLCDLGLKLGADVPFFIFGKNAFVQGIGEEIQEITLDSRQFLVMFPNQGIATKSIFQDPELTRDHGQITIDGFLASPWSDLSNDCQAVAMRICPEVKQALDWISQAVPGSEPRMSGSGSSVFVVLDPKTDVAKLENLLQNLPKGWIGRVVRGLNKNPAYNLISSE